jgi:hypothetical protein
MANTATIAKKETKATKAVAMKKENPSISNKEIAETLGMADAYVSQTLSKARDAGDLPSRATGTASGPALVVATRKTAKEALNVRGTPARKTKRVAKVNPVGRDLTGDDPGAILDARSQIVCMVQRIGLNTVKLIVEDVTG